MLIGITNKHLRAGDMPMDLERLEINTTQKLLPLFNGQKILESLTIKHGTHENYSRHVLRNHFYSMFDVNNDWIFPAFSTEIKYCYDFPFRAFFDTNKLFFELAGIAKFLELNFCPTEQLMQTHEKFLELNQGYHSEIKCTSILRDIWAGRSTAINLNIVEEAWLNWQITRSFQCCDLPILVSDQYPTNTLEISKAIFDCKAQNCLPIT